MLIIEKVKYSTYFLIAFDDIHFRLNDYKLKVEMNKRIYTNSAGNYFAVENHYNKKGIMSQAIILSSKYIDKKVTELERFEYVEYSEDIKYITVQNIMFSKLRKFIETFNL